MKYSILVLIVFWPTILFADWPDIDIELSTCKPDGLLANISHSWSPLKFWVKQNVAIEMALEQEDLSILLDTCRIEYKNDQTKLLECYQYYKNRHNSVIRCLKHTAKLCRHHGGRC